MAILGVEGFTGVPRASRNFQDGAVDPMASLGWTFQGRFSGTSIITADGNVQTQIVADPVFASRNVYKMAKTGTSTVDFVDQARLSIDTRGYSKFVFGGVFQYDTVANDANSVWVCLGGPTLWSSSRSPYPNSDIFAELNIPNNGGAGTAYGVMGTTQVQQQSPELVKGKPIHFEVLLEEDSRRCRVYLNGTLTLDMSLPSGYSFAKQDSGISLIMLCTPPGSTASAFSVSWSNIYFLGVDAVHTGVLGPGARVIEAAPAADLAVQFVRPSTYASNAAVLAQMFNATAPDYLTAGEPGTDLYTGINAVAANASKVYGAAMKVNATTMAEGTHTIAAAARSGATDWISPKTYTLTLGAIKPFVMDASVNPATGAVWTPAEVTASGIGFSLVQ